MRIAILLNSSWNIVNFRIPLISSLIENGHEIVALAPDINYKSEIEAIGCTYIPITHLSRKGTNPIKDIKLIFELRRVLRLNKIELLLNFTIKPNIYGTIAASYENVKAICTVTGLGYSFMSNSKLNSLVKKLYRYAFSKASIVVFQNPDDRELLVKLNILENQMSTLIYGSGVDIERFSPRSKTENQNSLDLLFVGRLLFDKGIKELLTAFTEVSKINDDLNLHIVGNMDEGNPASVDEAFLKPFRDHDKIHFHGFQKEVDTFIQESDIVILPSYREGLPRVLLEALSMARPIITTDVPGCREVIMHKKNGLLINAKSAEELESAILEMSNATSDDLVNMGKVGRKLCTERFSTEIVNQGYLKLISKLK